MNEFILTAGDGTELAAYAWEPDDKKSVKASIVIVHGIGEHATRYDDYAQYFNSRGIAVFSMDLRGNGKSPGVKGHTAPRSRVLEDIDYLCYYVKEVYPDAPIFIYGHSMGGNIGLSHRLYGAFRPRSYMITSPWLVLYNKPSSLKVAMLKLVASIKPDICIKSDIKSSEITSDQSEASVHHADSMAHGFISLKTAADCWNYALDIIDRAAENHGDILLMHGSDDRICSVEGSRKFAEKAGEACNYQEWPGCRHELQHDIHKLEVREMLANWVLERINKLY